MINENHKKELMVEIATKLIEQFMCYDEFKHGFDYKSALCYEIIEEVTGLPYDEIEVLRKKVFDDDEDDNEED